MPATTTVRVAIRATEEWINYVNDLARQRGLSTAAEVLAQLVHEEGQRIGHPAPPRLTTQPQGGRPRKNKPDQPKRPRGRPPKKRS